VRQILGATFKGWLISDGCWADHELDQRLRCLTHLIRKAQALDEGLEPAAQHFGTDILTVLSTVMAIVYVDRAARQDACPRARVAQRLEHLLGDPRASRPAVDQD
jgi:hypothetical protein